MKHHNSRRNFLKNSIQTAAILPFASSAFAMSDENSPFAQKPIQPSKSLNILILGGTSFLGPAQIAYALKRGHKISTFTRGKTKPTVHQELFKEVESLIGDRSNNLESLKGKKWDAVIDNSGHRLAWAQTSTELLKDQTELYLYTSSTGVYYPYLTESIKEDQKLLLKEPEVLDHEDEKLEYWYGVMKSNSEIATRKAFGESRSIIVRPTYMMGPGDRSDRFIHWPIRLSRGGEVLIPGKKADPVQYIDVRDVAEWMIRLLEQKATGTYNAVGPASATNVSQFVYGAHSAFSSPISYVEVGDYEFLKKHKVPYLVPWIMPEGKNWGSARVDNSWCMEKGLTLRPLANSVRDIYDWWYSDALSDERRKKYEENPESMLMREQALLAAWKQRG